MLSKLKPRNEWLPLFTKVRAEKEAKAGPLGIVLLAIAPAYVGGRLHRGSQSPAARIMRSRPGSWALRGFCFPHEWASVWGASAQHPVPRQRPSNFARIREQ